MTYEERLFLENVVRFFPSPQASIMEVLRRKSSHLDIVQSRKSPFTYTMKVFQSGIEVEFAADKLGWDMALSEIAQKMSGTPLSSFDLVYVDKDLYDLFGAIFTNETSANSSRQGPREVRADTEV